MVPSAGLPNLAEPGVVAFGAIIGGFIGYSAAWLSGGDEEDRVRKSTRGSYYGTAAGLAIYLLTNVRASGILCAMFRTWAIPYGIALAVLAPLILIADAPAWGWGTMYAIAAAVIAPTLLLHFWMEDRELEKRRARSDRTRRPSAR